MADEDAGFNEVSTVLWRERQLLELLLFKLEEEQLVLAAGRSRWLSNATREVETVLAEIRRVEVMRAMQVEMAVLAMRLPRPPTLRELAEHAPHPWGPIFSEHRKALLALTAEIEDVARTNRDILARGRDAVDAALQSIDGGVPHEPASYGADGSTPSRTGSLGLVNEAI
jgi:hypothetical protein